MQDSIKQQLNWRTSEVIAYLEEKIMDGMETRSEMKLYRIYCEEEKVNKQSRTYKNLVSEMKKSYESTEGIY